MSFIYFSKNPALLGEPDPSLITANLTAEISINNYTAPTKVKVKVQSMWGQDCTLPYSLYLPVGVEASS